MSKFAFNVSLNHQYKLDDTKTVHEYRIKDNQRKDIGGVTINSDTNQPNRLHVVHIAGDLGVKGVRQVSKQLSKFHPEAKVIRGRRISGARGDNDSLTAPWVEAKLK